VFAIVKPGATWFMAVRARDPVTFAPQLAQGVTQTWSSSADFTLIGDGDAYWHRFIIAHGEATTPLASDNAIEDAFVARVSLRAPPPLLLGVLRLLVWLRVLPKPDGPLVQDAQSISFRSDVMPGAAAIQRLLAQPPAYAPAMINFLAYRQEAQYPAGHPPVSGRKAYLRYGLVAMRTVYRTGGHLLFAGRITEVVRQAKAWPHVGRWDDVAAMRYPAPHAILSMEHAPDYHAALDDRDAGLDRTIVIASTPV
jgi:hypothetical protein